MARQARQLSESAIYHVMLRGVNREPIFREDADYRRFLAMLAEVKAVSGCLVFAYCLMPNHVHLLLRTTTEPIGLVLKRLGVRYAGWFNRKYARVGHLFQDRFKSLPVEDDGYLSAVTRYIWQNPVEAHLVERAEDYPWSSRASLGRADPLVDELALRHLVPNLDEFTESEVIDLDARRATGRPPRFRDESVRQLLAAAAGAEPGGIGVFPDEDQVNLVNRLLSAGVPYRQVSRVLGLSESFVYRVRPRSSKG